MDSINRAGRGEGGRGGRLTRYYFLVFRVVFHLGKKVTFLSALVGFNYKFLDVIRKVFDLSKLVMTF